MKFSHVSFLGLALLLGACSNTEPVKTAKKSSAVSSENGTGKKPSTKEDDEDANESGKDLPDDSNSNDDGDDKGMTDPKTPPKTETPTPETPKPEMPKPETPTKEEPKEEPKDPVDTSCYKAEAFICDIERIIDEETNKLRATVGKPPLTHMKEISFVSRQWSIEMGNRGSISHDGFPDARKAVWKAEFNSNVNFWAENAAQGNDDGKGAASIAKQLVNMWWNSPGHKANMLSDNTKIGTGISKKGSKIYGTQLFSK